MPGRRHGDLLQYLFPPLALALGTPAHTQLVNERIVLCYSCKDVPKRVQCLAQTHR